MSRTLRVFVVIVSLALAILLVGNFIRVNEMSRRIESVQTQLGGLNARLALAEDALRQTPDPTYTPYPTYTPNPTHTPWPSPTPSTGVCNPSWRDLGGLDLELTKSPQQARDMLLNELKRNTRVAFLPYPDEDERDFQMYLTYLSPQVVEAMALDKGSREGLGLQDLRQLIAAYDARLQNSNSVPFLVVLRATAPMKGETVSCGELEDTMVMVTENQGSIPPSEYAPALSLPINMSDAGLEGYILFPRNLGTGCTPSVDLLNDHRLDIHLQGIDVRDCDPTLGVPLCRNRKDLSVQWNFTLLPGRSLREVKDIPLPERASVLPPDVVQEILGLALSFSGL